MSSLKCPQCNLINFSTAISCKRCGHLFQVLESLSESAGGLDTTVQPENIQGVPQSGLPGQRSQTNSFRPEYPLQNHHPYPSPGQKVGLAITSLVLGIVGCFITSPIGLILGIVSLKRANKRPTEYGGKGLAIAGIVLNILQFGALPIILAIAIPNLLAARRSANEAGAMASIGTIVSAQAQYMNSTGTRNCADLSQLAQKNLLDSVLANGTKSGYLFVIVRLPQGCEIYATPVKAIGANATGTRSFYFSTEEGTFRGAAKHGLMADATDTPLEFGNPPPRIASR